MGMEPRDQTTHTGESNEMTENNSTLATISRRKSITWAARKRINKAFRVSSNARTHKSRYPQQQPERNCTKTRRCTWIEDNTGKQQEQTMTQGDPEREWERTPKSAGDWYRREKGGKNGICGERTLGFSHQIPLTPRALRPKHYNDNLPDEKAKQ